MTTEVDTSNAVAKVEELVEDSRQFEKVIEGMIKRAQSLKGARRTDTVNNYRKQLERFHSDTDWQLTKVNNAIDRHMKVRVGEFVEKIGSNFGAQSAEATVNQGFEYFKSENIPPVNLPAIVANSARIAALQHKMFLIKQAEIAIGGQAPSPEFQSTATSLKQVIDEVLEAPGRFLIHAKLIYSYANALGINKKLIRELQELSEDEWVLKSRNVAEDFQKRENELKKKLVELHDAADQILEG